LRDNQKEKVLNSFLNTVMAHDTIIAFLENFPSSSQHVSCIFIFIKKQPSKEFILWYTLGFPNPQNSLDGSDFSKLILIVVASKVSMLPPYEVPRVFSIQIYGGKGAKILM
jgi:hypothetical protein